MEGNLKGIKLISIVNLVFGFGSFAYLLYGCFSWVFDFKKNSVGVNIFCFVMLVLLFLIGVVLIKLGLQILRLNSKAIIGNIILAVFIILEFLGSHLQYQNRRSELIRLVLLMYSVWILFYLNRRKVKEQFK